MSDVATARTAAAPSLQSLSLQSVARAAALVVAGGWVGYFLFTGMPQLTLQVYPRTVTLHILIGALALLYVGWLAYARRLPGGTPLDFAVLGLVAAYALATYTSLYWRVSLEATLWVAAAMIVCYALADLPLLSASQLARALMLVGAALALYAIWTVGSDYADYLRLTRSVEGLDRSNIFPPTVPRVHDVSDNPNILAMVLVLVVPFFAVTAARPNLRWERWAAVAALAVTALALFLTLSRGAWAGAAVAVALAAAGVWMSIEFGERERSGAPLRWTDAVPRNISPTAIATVGGALALAVFGALAFLARSSTRPGWLFRGSLSPREDAWRAGWHMLQDHPWTGAGPNTFALLYNEYSGKFPLHTQHAHNGFLQFAIDTGVIGVIALIALAAVVAYMLARAWRRGNAEQRLVAVACASALAGFSVHNMVDAGNIWKSSAIALAVVAAIVVRTYRESAPREPAASAPSPDVPRWRPAFDRARTMAPRAALLALLVAPFLAWYRIDRAHHDAWTAMTHFYQRGDPAHPVALREALSDMQSAVDRDSSLAVYQLQLGQMQATVYQEANRPDDNRGLIAAAVAHLQRAVALDPRSDVAHADLARAYQLAGREDDAASEAAKTRVIARDHVQPMLVAGEVYEDIGRRDDAIATYGQAISINASLAASSYWDQTAFRRASFGEILSRSGLGLNACTHGAYLVEAHAYDAASSLTGIDTDEQGCRLLVFSLPNDLTLRVALARILMQQGKLDDAYGHLRAAVDRQPDFGPARTELGRWYQAKGDLAAARHEWVVGGQLDEPESLLLLGESYPDGSVPGDVVSRLRSVVAAGGANPQADILTILYYRMKYARVSPVDPMIPGGWQQAEPRLYARIRDALMRWGGESARAGASRVKFGRP